MPKNVIFVVRNCRLIIEKIQKYRKCPAGMNAMKHKIMAGLVKKNICKKFRFPNKGTKKMYTVKFFKNDTLKWLAYHLGRNTHGVFARHHFAQLWAMLSKTLEKMQRKSDSHENCINKMNERLWWRLLSTTCFVVATNYNDEVIGTRNKGSSQLAFRSLYANTGWTISLFLAVK